MWVVLKQIGNTSWRGLLFLNCKSNATVSGIDIFNATCHCIM